MTEEQIFAIFLMVSFFACVIITGFIDERIRIIRERRRKKQAYISYIEKQNLQLRRTVNFLRFQAQLKCEKAGDSDGSVHTVQER